MDTMVPFLKSMQGYLVSRKKSLEWDTLKCPRNYLWVVVFGFLFFSLISFAKMNIYGKHCNKILLSTRECRPNHLSWQKYSPSHFQSQHFLLRSPGPELLQGGPRSGKQYITWEQPHGHRLGFQVWLGQRVPLRLTTPQRGGHVTQGHSAPAHGPRARALWLSVGLFCDSQSWSPRCVLLSSLRHHREESVRGKSIFKELMVAFAWLFLLVELHLYSVFSSLPASRSASR